MAEISLPHNTKELIEGLMAAIKPGPPTIFVTYHPASVLRGGGYEPAILEDLARPRQAALQVPKDGLPEASKVGFDTEYYFKPSHPVKPVVVTAAISDSQHVKVYDKEEVTKARQVIRADVLCGHNITVDLDSLASLGLAREDWLRGENILDSLLLAKMVDENKEGKGAYKLETLFLQNFKTESWKAETEIYGHDPRQWPDSERKRRCGLDAWATYLLCRKLIASVKGPIEFNHKVAQTLRRIYLAGAVIDLTIWGRLKRQYTREVNHLREQLTKFAHRKGMKEFSPTNDNHIRELVYSRLRCPILNRTEKTNLPAVDKITLQQLHAPSVEKLILFSKSDKILNTYLLSLQELWTKLDSDRALLRFPIHTLGARTTRRTSSKPNAQNWPPEVKAIVVSRFKGGKILSVDYCVA
ncbi:MAG: DNA polymerase, partial [Nitrososphaera sp.]|nr:DNA polymerase [Nitrososphaera sp.]